jgi:hypothetical protein
VGEGRNLQLIFQGFNITNRANYGNNFNDVVDATNAAGTPLFGHPAGFINPSSSLLPRSFTGEFGARFTF